jgi:hypothetical protein
VMEGVLDVRIRRDPGKGDASGNQGRIRMAHSLQDLGAEASEAQGIVFGRAYNPNLDYRRVYHPNKGSGGRKPGVAFAIPGAALVRRAMSGRGPEDRPHRPVSERPTFVWVISPTEKRTVLSRDVRILFLSLVSASLLSFPKASL